MSRDSYIALFATPFVALLGAGFAYVGSAGQPFAGGLHLFASITILAFAIQWVAFVPAIIKQTEHFFDLVGALTFIMVAAFAYVTSGNYDTYATIALLLIIVWAARIGTFLFRRVRTVGKDQRFDMVKTSFLQFLLGWTLQGFWVTFTSAAAIGAILAPQRPEFGSVAVVGLAVWALGFAFEAVADHQKSRFKADPANRDKFIDVGLWSMCRHPNYFGEIVLWTGVAIFAIPALEGLTLWLLLSPVFVAVLLVLVSGVPPLQMRADAKWGGQPAYERYKATTPAVVPRLWRARDAKSAPVA